MRFKIVYASRYGNTARIARAMTTRLEATGAVYLVNAADPTAFDLDGVDVLFVGGPTEGHGLSVSLKERLANLPSGALNGVMAAAFDTRLDWPAVLAGSAAHSIAESLHRKGAQIVAQPESFLGHGLREFRLKDGELERAASWAAAVTSSVTALAR